MNRLVTLSVRNTLPFPRRNEPVATGIPVPKTAGLRRAGDLALYDQDGRRVPAQFAPLAHWEDGIAVKWALLHFRTDAEAGAERRYDLVAEPRADDVGLDDGTAPRRIATETPEGVLLDTGVWRGTIGADGALVSGIEVKAGEAWRPVSSAEGGLYGTAETVAGGTRYVAGKPRERIVEENGTERAIVKIAGSYVPAPKQPQAGEAAESGAEDGLRGRLAYEIRIEAYRGKTELKLTHTVAAGPDGAHFAELALRLPMPVERISAGGGDGVLYEQDGVAPGRTLGIIHYAEDEYGCGALDPAAPEHRRENGRHDGWLAARNGRAAVVATIRHFAETYPKSVETNGDELTIGLLPGRSDTKDSFVPANQMLDRYSLAPGEARTHELLLAFAAPDLSDEAARRMSAAFHRPMLALAPWDWYTDSGALGDLIPRSDRYEDYEKAVDDTLASCLRRRDALRLYGDRNFGDDQYGKPGVWNNGEYDYAHVGMLHFLRGAGRDWFERYALPAARHMMDIDVCHAGPHAGKVHQHGERHNSETPKLGSHAWIRGLLEYYCFTGDLRARDVALKVADTWSADILGRGVAEGTERGITWPVVSMLAAYGTFPKPAYLEAASLLVRTVLDCHDPLEGDFKGTMSRPTTKNNWGTFVIGSPVLESLVLYEQTTGDVRAKETVVRAARRLARLNWLPDVGAWEYTHSMLSGGERVHNAKTDKMVTPAVLYGYLYSGDGELLAKAMSAFAHSAGVPSGSGKDVGQSYCFGVRIPALLERAKSMKEGCADDASRNE
ncbi:hypothetical protein [Paenibacillus sp. GYB003]|uniref:hypothetical protein n=1 Tax=Paenibacillus sp. GYB003 TaxID=2994392 RepID=UPI002F961357